MTTQEWKAKGEYHSIYGHQVFTVSEGTADQTLLILHGYPTSSFDFWKTLPPLTKKYRVILHDHLGFGLSDKPLNYSYSLIEQADIALALWQKMGIKKAHLLAHDYGTSVATEILARFNRGQHTFELESLTLCNGSMHIELAKLRPIQKVLLNKTLAPIVSKFARQQLFIRNMKNIWYDKSKADIAELKEMWQQMICKNGRAVLPQLTQYINERHKYWHRWIGALQQTETPVNILWATEDPVAVVEMAHTLHSEIPNNKLQLLEKLGHYPMVEDADRWTNSLLKMLEQKV